MLKCRNRNRRTNDVKHTYAEPSVNSVLELVVPKLIQLWSDPMTHSQLQAMVLYRLLDFFHDLTNKWTSKYRYHDDDGSHFHANVENYALRPFLSNLFGVFHSQTLFWILLHSHRPAWRAHSNPLSYRQIWSFDDAIWLIVHCRLCSYYYMNSRQCHYQAWNDHLLKRNDVRELWTPDM